MENLNCINAEKQENYENWIDKIISDNKKRTLTIITF